MPSKQMWSKNIPKMGWLRTTYVSVTWVILWLLGRPEIKRNETKERIEKRYEITSGQSYSIHWIETVLKTPIEDYRKNALALILASYVINIKKLSYDEAFSIIKEWLSKCDELQPLDSKFDYRIKSSIGYFAEKNNQLHKILIQKVNWR